MRLAVVGLGKLGLPLALVLAEAGHEVQGYDANLMTVDAIRSGKSPIVEAGVDELLESTRDRLALDTVIGTEMRSVEVCFIIVPTPSVETGAFTNRYVLEAVTSVAAQFKKSIKHRPVIVIVSTVMPGSCSGAITESVETASGREVGESIGLCYSPEFIALGSVVHDLRNPDMVLIGASDPRSGAELEEILVTVVGDDVPIHHMSLVDAEVAKVAVNAYVTMKISFANVLAEVCEGLPGADARSVATAIGHDGRIGGRYLQPATAYGGPCFPRDTHAFAALARQTGASPALADATHAVNRRQVVRLAEMIRAALLDGGRIGILGLAYKVQTPVFEASAGVSLLAELLCASSAWTSVLVYDPLATVVALFPDAPHAHDPQELVDLCDLVVITTPWSHFADLDYSKVGKVIDCWDIVPDGPNIVRVGVGS